MRFPGLQFFSSPSSVNLAKNSGRNFDACPIPASVFITMSNRLCLIYWLYARSS